MYKFGEQMKKTWKSKNFGLNLNFNIFTFTFDGVDNDADERRLWT